MKQKRFFNSQDLKDSLWSTLQDLKKKKTNAATANAVAAQAREIMRIVKMEVQVTAMSGQKPGKKMLEFTGGA
jgi:hypothetical protein